MYSYFVLVSNSCRWGLFKVSAVLVPSIWAGAALSRRAAAYLEENDIFIPEDDDD